MRIPNKFNGYSADNIRLYNDPVTLTALTAAGAEGSMIAAPALAGATAAGTAAALPGIVGGAGALAPLAGEAAGIAAAAPQLAGTASTLAQASPEIASNLASGSAQGIMQGAGTLPAAGSNASAALPIDQVSAAAAPPPAAPGTPTPGAAAPGTPTSGPMPNVSTTPTPADAQASAEYYTNAASNDLNQQIASKVGANYEASNGIMQQLKNFTDPLMEGFNKATDYAKKNPMTTAAGLYALGKFTQTKPSEGGGYSGKHADMSKFKGWNPSNPYIYGANGGIMSSYADGGPVEQMSNMNAIGANTMYPMANISPLEYANPVQQRPVSQNVIDVGDTSKLDPYTGMPTFAEGGMTNFQKMLKEEEEKQKDIAESLYSHGRAKVEDRGIVSRPISEQTADPYTAAVNRLKKASQVAGIKIHEPPKLNMPESFSSIEAANGGIMHGLGGYSDGGRLLKGPGDGVSDSIPAVIGSRQPARLADGEFVIPARIVSELGNGSTEAGARKLYAMMERVQKARHKTVGKNKVAVNSKADKHLPA